MPEFDPTAFVSQDFDPTSFVMGDKQQEPANFDPGIFGSDLTEGLPNIYTPAQRPGWYKPFDFNLSQGEYDLMRDTYQSLQGESETLDNDFNRGLLTRYYNDLDGSRFTDEEALKKRIRADLDTEDYIDAVDKMRTINTPRFKKIQTFEEVEDSEPDTISAAPEGVEPEPMEAEKPLGFFAKRAKFIKEYSKVSADAVLDGLSEMRSGSYRDAAINGEITGTLKDRAGQGFWQADLNNRTSLAVTTKNREALFDIITEEDEINQITGQAMDLSDTSFLGKIIPGLASVAPNIAESSIVALYGSLAGPWGSKAGTTAYWQQQGAGTFLRGYLRDQDLNSISDEKLDQINGVAQTMAVPYALVELAVSSIPGIKAFGSSVDSILSKAIMNRVMKNPTVWKKAAEAGTSALIRFGIEAFIEESTQQSIDEATSQMLEKVEAGDWGALLRFDWSKIGEAYVEGGTEAAPAVLGLSLLGLGGDIRTLPTDVKLDKVKKNVADNIVLPEGMKKVALRKLNLVETPRQFETWLNETLEEVGQTTSMTTQDVTPGKYELRLAGLKEMEENVTVIEGALETIGTFNTDLKKRAREQGTINESINEAGDKGYSTMDLLKAFFNAMDEYEGTEEAPFGRIKPEDLSAARQAEGMVLNKNSNQVAGIVDAIKDFEKDWDGDTTNLPDYGRISDSAAMEILATLVQDGGDVNAVLESGIGDIDVGPMIEAFAGEGKNAGTRARDLKATLDIGEVLIDLLALSDEQIAELKEDWKSVNNAASYRAWYNKAESMLNETRSDENIETKDPVTKRSAVDLLTAYYEFAKKNNLGNVEARILEAMRSNDQATLDKIRAELEQFAETWDLEVPKSKLDVSKSIALQEFLAQFMTEERKIQKLLDASVTMGKTRFTPGEFATLGETKKDLIEVLQAIEPELAGILISATAGDKDAQAKWNEYAYKAEIFDKVEQGIELTEQEQIDFEEAQREAYEATLQQDEDLKEVDEAARPYAERNRYGADSNASLGFWTRLKSWANPMAAIEALAPGLANKLSRYEVRHKTLYNEYFEKAAGEGGADLKKQLQSFNRIEILIRALERMISSEDMTEVSKMIGMPIPTWNEMLANFYENGIFEYLGLNVKVKIVQALASGKLSDRMEAMLIAEYNNLFPDAKINKSMSGDEVVSTIMKGGTDAFAALGNLYENTVGAEVKDKAQSRLSYIKTKVESRKEKLDEKLDYKKKRAEEKKQEKIDSTKEKIKTQTQERQEKYDSDLAELQSTHEEKLAELDVEDVVGEFTEPKPEINQAKIDELERKINKPYEAPSRAAIEKAKKPETIAKNEAVWKEKNKAAKARYDTNKRNNTKLRDEIRRKHTAAVKKWETRKRQFNDNIKNKNDAAQKKYNDEVKRFNERKKKLAERHDIAMAKIVSRLTKSRKEAIEKIETELAEFQESVKNKKARFDADMRTLSEFDFDKDETKVLFDKTKRLSEDVGNIVKEALEKYTAGRKFRPAVDPKKRVEYRQRIFEGDASYTLGTGLGKTDIPSLSDELNILAEDVDLFVGVSETIEKKLKAYAVLEARTELFRETDEGEIKYDENGKPVDLPFNVVIDEDGNPVSDFTRENIYALKDLQNLTDKQMNWLANTVFEILSKDNVAVGFAKWWKTLVLPLISMPQTAIKQLGDISKIYNTVRKISGAKNAFTITAKAVRNSFGKGLESELTQWADQVLGDKLTIGSIGAEVVDIDLPQEEITAEYIKYAKELFREMQYERIDAEISGLPNGVRVRDIFEWWDNGKVPVAIQHFWKKGSLTLLRVTDTKMKNAYLEASIEALRGLPEAQRVEKLTEILRGDAELAFEVSQKLMSRTLDDDTRTALYNIMNALHPLSSFDRAPLFRKAPIFGIYQSFAMKQTSILYKMIAKPLQDSFGYARTGRKYYALMREADIRIADIKARLEKTTDQATIDALEANLATAQSDYAKAKKQTAYSVKMMGKSHVKAGLAFAEYTFFFTAMDFAMATALRELRRLTRGDDEPEDVGKELTDDFLRDWVDSMTPVVKLGAFVSDNGWGNPISEVTEGMFSTPVPFSATQDAMYKLIWKDDPSEMNKLLREIPMAGSILYNISEGIKNEADWTGQ